MPRALGYVHPRRGTPAVGVAAVWAVSVALVAVGVRDPNYYYEFFGLQLVFAWMVSWLLTLIAAVVYRSRHAAEVRSLPWRQPLYPLFPVAGLLGITVVTYYTVESAPTTVWVGAAWITAAGSYYGLVARRKVKPAEQPAPNKTAAPGTSPPGDSESP